MTVSVGVAEIEALTSPAEIVSRADRALYHAKRGPGATGARAGPRWRRSSSTSRRSPFVAIHPATKSRA